MADKPVVPTFSSDSRLKVSDLNDALDILAEGVKGCLGRGGTGESPNSMSGDLDADLNKIRNLGVPSADNDAVRLVDLSDSDATGAASAQLRTDLASTDNGKGASLIGVEDSGGNFTGTTVEDVLTEVGVFTQTGTGAVAQLATTKLKELVSVKDFGVTGDGSTDDTANFLKAITAHEQVYVPSGTYVLDNLTAVSANTLILDAAATLKHKDSSVSNMIVSAYDFTIIGGNVNGNKANITQRDKSTLKLSGDRIKVEGVEFQNTIFNAIWIDGTPEEVRITDNYIHNMQEHSGVSGETTMGILIRANSGTSPHIWFTGNRIIHETVVNPLRCPGGVIVDGDGIESLFIQDNYFENIGQNNSPNFIGNIDLYTTADKTVISGNRIKNYYFVALKLQNSGKLMVSDNLVDGNGATTSSSAVFVQNARNIGSVFSDVSLIGNIINLSNLGSGTRGILVYGDAEGDDFFSRVAISNNIVQNTEKGIELKWCSDICLSNNIIDTTTAEGILISDTDTGAGKPTIAKVSITGGSVQNCGGIGISCATNVGNNHLHMSNIQFEANTTDHVRADSNSKVQVIGCLFTDTPSSGDFLDLRTNDNVLVVGNHSVQTDDPTFSGNTNARIMANNWQDRETYTETNVTTDRAFDADTVAVAELADVVGTLIVDLRAQGLVS